MHLAGYAGDGLLMVLAVAGAILVVLAGKRLDTALATVLAAAVFLVPAGQAYSLSDTSLGEHMVYGTWLGSIAAGAGIALLFRGEGLGVAKRRALVAGACALAAFVVISSWQGAWYNRNSWANSAAYTAALRRDIPKTGSIYVLDNSGGTLAVSQFYTPQGLDWSRWQDANLLLGSPAISLQQDSPATVVLFYHTSLSLSAKALFKKAGISANQELLNLSAAGVPGLASLTSALEHSSSYRLASIGSYSTGIDPGVFAIWVKR
jgi:hypothetical protein